MNDIDQIIKLLDHWKNFKEKSLSDDLGQFGLWLNEKENKKKEIPDDYTISPNMTIGFLLGGILGYLEVWTKMTFRNLPIQNFHDFGTLKFIEALKNPTKKEIAEDSLVEQSTCFEALKRMAKNELVEEETDERDKRVKRVKLTKYGKEITDQATHQAYLLSSLLVGDITDDEKQVLIGVLQKLDNFHEDLYRKVDRDKIIEYYKL